MSFRGRLLAAALVTFAVGLGALLVIGNVLLNASATSQTSSVLRARAEAQLAALSIGASGIRVRETPNDRALDREAWVFEGNRVLERPVGATPALNAAAVALARTDSAAEREAPGDYRLRAVPIRKHARLGTIVVATSVAPTERLSHDVLVGSIVLATALLLAAWLAISTALRGALRPVEQMTQSAEDWGAHDLDRRFALGPPRDELTGLAATLDHLLARIAASRRHEQQFASEVAHELRTPIAGLRGRAELALDATGPRADEERRIALEAVVAQADRLEAAIDSLMALSRQELDPRAGTVDVAAVARSFEEVDVSAPAQLPYAEGEGEIVRRALAPLVDNAHKHGGGRVRLELAAREGFVEVRVRDDGPGVEPSFRERAFEPGVQGEGRNGDGAGLGLPLARRLARSCGGEVVAGEGPGGCFVLRLPQVAR